MGHVVQMDQSEARKKVSYQIAWYKLPMMHLDFLSIKLSGLSHVNDRGLAYAGVVPKE